MSDALFDALSRIIASTPGRGTSTVRRKRTSYERQIERTALEPWRARQKAKTPHQLARQQQTPALYATETDEFAKWATSADAYFYEERVTLSVERVEIADRTLINGRPSEGWKHPEYLRRYAGERPSDDVLEALGVDLLAPDVRAAIAAADGDDQDVTPVFALADAEDDTPSLEDVLLDPVVAGE